MAGVARYLFQQKSVIVTGGATGIGAAIVRAFADAQANVFSLDLPAAHKTSSSSSNVTRADCDVTNVAALTATVAAIGEEHGLDVLVCNAGVWSDASVDDATEAEFERVVSVNIKGSFFAIQAALPWLRPSGGSIALIGSDQSIVGKPGQGVYGLTKGAIAQLTKSTSAALAADGIRVNCICPGSIDTPLLHDAVRKFALKTGKPEAELHEWLQTAQPVPRIGRPSEVAQAVLSSCCNEFMTGAIISVDGGYTAV